MIRGHAMTLLGIHHVSLPRPAGAASGAVARQFYGGVLGLRECVLPAGLEGVDVVWFHIGAGELHLYAAADDGGGGGRHACLHCADLTAITRQLERHGIAWQPGEPVIRGRPRLFCRDPFGNLLEITALDDGAEP